MFPAKESLCAHGRAELGRTHPVLLFILVTLVFSSRAFDRPGAAAQPNLDRQFGRSSRFQNPKRHEHQRTVYRDRTSLPGRYVVLATRPSRSGRPTAPEWLQWLVTLSPTFPT